MKLNEALKERGLTKQKLAELMGVSRQTIQRMGNEVTDEALEAINGYVIPVAEIAKSPEDYTDDEIKDICKRRGGMPGDVAREKETDYEIACSLGITVFDFHKMIDRMAGKVRPQIARREAALDAFLRANPQKGQL